MKPCPFCGGVEIDREGTITELRGETAYQATCAKCQSTGPAALKPRGAEIAWNRRAVIAKNDGLHPPHARGGV